MFEGIPIASAIPFGEAMSAPIVDRLTAAIRIADQCLHNTQFQADVINWTEARNVMLAARDELGKTSAPGVVLNLADIASANATIQAVTAKIDGRTREARAAKAAQ